jgi:hypothetical protein
MDIHNGRQLKNIFVAKRVLTLLVEHMTHGGPELSCE